MGTKSSKKNLTLEDVMKWAFKAVKKKGKDEKPNLEFMLGENGRNKIKISTIIERIEKDMGGKLTRVEQAQLREILRKTKHRNVIIHSRQVLQYMWDLYMHNSTIPPPWVC